MISDLIHGPRSSFELTWHDPIVVNETAGWLTLKSETDPQLGVGHEQPCDSKPLCTQTKNPRGRLKKKTNKKRCEPRTPPLQRSCVEALVTWNTTKLIGISLTDENAVISGLRKLKRLMIMDGLPD